MKNIAARIRWCLAVALAAALAFPIAAEPNDGLQGLRAYAAKKGLDLGVAVNFKQMGNARYTAAVAGEFSYITPENEMKWEYIHSLPEGYDWFFGDSLLAFAQANGMKLRGHALVWHSQVARWVQDAAVDKESLLKIVRDHCSTIVAHYRGKVAKWDVANEVVDDKEGLRQSLFYLKAGTDFIDEAFKAARAADPAALLYINDYSVEDICPKSDRLYALVKGMLARGVPIDGVGLQSHWDLDALPSMASVRANIERFAALGLKVDITELDIRFKGPASDERLAAQAAAYAEVLKVALTAKGVSSVTVWGLDDGHSWIRNAFPGYANATLLDKSYAPKPAYRAWLELLKQ